MGDWLALSWKVLVVRGVIGVAFGVMAMVWPDLTVLVLVVLLGIWALVEAVTQGAAAFSSGADASMRILYGLSALAALIAGLFAILRPGMAAVTITWVIGIWLIVRAAFGVAAAFSRTRETSRGMLLVGAAIDVVLGLLLVANPGRAALDIAWLLGLIAVIWGVVFIVAGILARKALSVEGQPPATANA